VACSHLAELHNIAGGAILMEYFATDSLNEVKDKLSHIFVQYDNVLPFSRVKEVHLDCP
jgi:hypothetical protein